MVFVLQRTWNILSYIILFKNKNNSSETVCGLEAWGVGFCWSCALKSSAGIFPSVFRFCLGL